MCLWIGRSPFLVERAAQRAQIAPGEPLLERAAQEIGGVERRERADLALAKPVGEPAPAGAQDAVLDPEQLARGRAADADQEIRVRELDLAFQEGLADRDLLGRRIAIAR